MYNLEISVRPSAYGLERGFVNTKVQTGETTPHRNGTLPSGAGDALDVRRRIGELRQLQDGWLDGKGLAPDPQGLTWLAERFDAFDPARLPRPYLFPTPEGGVLAEWPRNPWSLSLEIDLSARIGRWHALDLDTDAEETAEIDLNRIESWERLAEWVVGREPVVA